MALILLTIGTETDSRIYNLKNCYCSGRTRHCKAAVRTVGIWHCHNAFSVTSQKLISKHWQRTGNCGVLHALLVWKASKQHLNKQPAIVVLADTLLLRLYSSWTCLPSVWQNLCVGLRSPQSYPCPSTTAQQLLTSHQCNVIVEIDWLPQASKQAIRLGVSSLC